MKKYEILVSSEATSSLLQLLENFCCSIIRIPPAENLDPRISGHPDMLYCSLSSSTIFKGDSSLLSGSYPGDAIYNGASTGRFFIHNTAITHPDLLEAALAQNLIPVKCSQGYAKCNCVVVDENSIITSDKGIASSCRRYGIDVLLISPGNVLLEGYGYGFIGGASGKIGDTIIFNGNLSLHPDASAIRDFIHEKSLKTADISDYPLTDIGSILARTLQPAARF